MLPPFCSKKRSGLFPAASFILIAFLAGALPGVLNFAVDPYQVFTNRDRPTEINDIAEKSHYPLWKLAKYRRGTHDTIVLGDSRARALRDKYWHELGMDRTLNLSYGGGTIPEIYSTFELIKDDRAIRNLVIGIQLRSFDENHKKGMNRVPEAVHLLRNRLEYLKNWSVSHTAWDMFKAQSKPELDYISDLQPLLAKPAAAGELGTVGNVPLSRLLEPKVCFGCELPQDLASIVQVRRDLYSHGLRGLGYRDGGWLDELHSQEWTVPQNLYSIEVSLGELPKKFATQVRKNGAADWRGFEFSRKYWNHLLEIAEWSKASDVKLVFVIPPTIVDMQKTIQANGFGKLNHKFRLELAKLGTVIDLDFTNPVTRNIRNFNDAYHFNSKIARLIVGEVVQHLIAAKTAVTRALKGRKQLACAGPASQEPHLEFRNSIHFFESANCRVWRIRS